MKIAELTEQIAEEIVSDAHEKLSEDNFLTEGETASTDPMPEAERKHYEDILKMNVLVREAQDSHDVAKSRAKAAKEVLDEYSMRLSVLISEGPQKPDPQKELPFEEVPPWRDTPVTEVLKLTEKQIEKLEEAGIKTIGRLEDVRGGQDPDYPRGLRSIKGFGEKTIDALENDIVDWLSKNAREPEAAE